MKIGIDIDDVITGTSEVVKDCVLACNKDGELVELMEDIMRGDKSNPIVEKFFDENSMEIFENVKIKPNAREVMGRLIGEGHEIFIITARGDTLYRNGERHSATYLREQGVPYTKVFWDVSDKAKICKEYGVNVMVDDSIEHCTLVNESGILSLLFNSEVNLSLATNLERVNDWLELEKRIGSLL